MNERALNFFPSETEKIRVCEVVEKLGYKKREMKPGLETSK